MGSYAVVVSNAHGSVTSNPAMLRMDANTNGIPDDWEMTYFGNLDQASGLDFDNDGILNREEYEQGTDPSNPASYAPRLSITSLGGTVEVSPEQEHYAIGQTVTLTATPTPGNQFTSWSGSVTGTTNPVTLVLDGHKSVTAAFRNARIWSWGHNQFSQATNDSPELLDTVSLAGGGDFSLALKADGTVRGWGQNFASQTPPFGLVDVIAISAGNWQGFALQSDGRVQSWGGGYSGSATDPKVPAGLANVVAIQGSRGSGTALKANGTVVTWGGWVPQPPVGLSGVIALAAGQSHGVALKLDGTVVAWGGNNVGQTDVPAGLSDVVAISSGSGESSHTLALKSDGTVVAWGYNNAGQCNVPAGLTDVVAIAAGDYHNLALKSDGTVVCWGSNNEGQCNLPSGMAGIVAIAAGSRHNLALAGLESNPLAPVIISPPSAIACVGMPFHYRIVAMNGADSFTASGLPEGLILDESTGIISGSMGSAGFQQVTLTSSNGSSTSSLILDLSVVPVTPEFTFASTMEAKLGNPFSELLVEYGTTVTASGLPAGLSFDPGTSRIVGIPTEAGVFRATFTATHSSNADHVVRKTLDVNVREVVDGLVAPYSPAADRLTGIESVRAGWDHYVALKDDGTVVAWSNNGNFHTDVPTGVSDVVAVDAGANHSIALKRDGSVVAWGSNSQATTVPPGVGNVVAVASGFSHNLVLRADGTVIGWGNNDSGQLDIPAGLSNVIAIDAGSGHNLALKSDGTVVAWGQNNWGQRDVPAGLADVVQIVAAHTNSMALRSDGSVVTWTASNGTQSDAVMISNGMVLKHNGTVAGIDGGVVPSELVNVVGITTGYTHVAWLAPVRPLDEPTIISASGAISYLDSPFHHRVVALHHPTSFSATGLPDGLTLNPATGVISGSPAESGTFEVMLEASNNTRSASSPLTIHVLLPKPQLIPVDMVNSYFGNAFSRQVIQYATESDVTGLPPGLAYDAATGWISGEPLQSGVFTVNLSASNPSGNQGKAFQLAVHEVFGNRTVPPAGLTDVVSVAASNHYLALRGDGTVTAWGANHHGQASVPPGLTNVIAVAAGGEHSLALRGDGTLVGWGRDHRGQLAIPPDLGQVLAVSARDNHSLALKADGKVVGWGENSFGQLSIPPDLADVVEVSAGSYHGLALKADGTVSAWGWNAEGQGVVPAGLGEVISVCAGHRHNLVIRTDGSLLTWGNNSTLPPLPGAADYLGLAAGEFHNLVLKPDGSVVAWGNDAAGQVSSVSALSGVKGIAARYDHSLVLLGNGPAVSTVPLKKWRFQHFSSLARSGIGADLADPDGDGLANLIEFATGTSPMTGNPVPGTLGALSHDSGSMNFIYSRSKSARYSVDLRVEWSDGLTGGNWSEAGITEEVLVVTGDLEQVKATIPVGNLGRRFVRLRASSR